MIHWAETVLLPASLPFCLTLSNGCTVQKGDSAINRDCSLMKGAEVLHIADRTRLMFAADERACVPSV